MRRACMPPPPGECARSMKRETLPQHAGVKSCTYDWDGPPQEAPRVGDQLVTKTGVRWQVLESRQVKSRVHPSRWALKILRVPAGLFSARREIPLEWASRGPKK